MVANLLAAMVDDALFPLFFCYVQKKKEKGL
jgi:hypothetical protein